VPADDERDRRADIAALLATYFQAVDAGDRSTVPSLFTRDGEFHGIDGRFVGRSELADFFGAAGTSRDRRRHGGGVHVASPAMITIDPVDADAATAWSTALYVVPGPDGAPQLVFAGEYHDQLRWVNGSWLFAVRRVVARAVAA
jgi:hypothetical protein